LGPERIERRLAAILAADVAGYSRLMGADEEGTHAASIALRREVSEPKIAQHRGCIVKTTGDGFLAEFASVVDAGRCAVELHREMALRNDDVPSERRIQFRIGIDGGPVLLFGHIERFEARRANMRAVAAPMPDAAPEMMATFPASLNAGFPLLLWADRLAAAHFSAAERTE
jgi:class 3 adenylate cyclase